MSFGSELKRIRNEEGIGVNQLAMQSGVSASQISRFENGIKSNPKPETLRKLAKGLKKDESDIFRIAGLSVSSTENSVHASPLNKKIGHRISYQRSRLHLSPSDLARRTGMNLETVNNWESGLKPVNSESLITLARIFDVTTDYLLGIETDLGSVPVAAHLDDDFSNLTRQEQQEINDYIEFKKAQYKKRHEKD